MTMRPNPDFAATQTLQPDDAQLPAEPSQSYVLVVEERSSLPFPLPAEGEVLVGRDEGAGLRINHPSISRQHARILVSPAGISISDLRSHNGTVVNGEKIAEARPLLSGDVVTVGVAQLVFHRGMPRRVAPTIAEAAQLARRLNEELARAEQYQHTLAVVCLELAGALAADRAAAATALTPQLRMLDFAAWQGRSTLTLLLPDLDREEVLGRLQALLRPLATQTGQPKAAYALYPSDGVDPDTLLGLAQEALRHTPVGQIGDAAICCVTHQIGDKRAIAADPAMIRAFEQARQLADDDLPVLVTGETGTGKELVTAAFHYWSKRRERPYVVQNCAGLPDNLVDDILFGHERGAFTDAKESSPGLFERVQGGTLFLDEIGELSMSVQAKLLRVLENHTGERLGPNAQTRRYDFRLVAATNRDLRERVRNGHFRQDLYYRLAGVTLFLKPLRERPREITQLAQAFFKRETERRGLPGPLPQIADATYQCLHAHAWPGNVRELANLMSQLAATVREPVIERWHLPAELRGDAPAAHGSLRLDPSSLPPSEPSNLRIATSTFRPIEQELKELEKRRIQEALAAAQGARNTAARLLGMPERTFYKRLKEYGIALS